MTPYVDDRDFQLYVGDVRQVLAELPAESVDCVVTSPPYWGLRDYGTGQWAGGNPDCDHLDAPFRTKAGINASCGTGTDRKNAADREPMGQTCSKCGASRVDQQIGLEATPELFVQEMVAVFREVRRVLAPHGTLWLNLGDSYNANVGAGFNANARIGHQDTRVASGLPPKNLLGMPWRVAFALQQPYYAGTIRNELDRVWLAAMIDAEGCIYVHRRKAGQSNGQGYERKNDTYGSGLEISNTSLALIERVMEITGRGSISSVEKGSDSRRRQTLYRWNLRTNECRDVLREVYPYLIAKRQQARIAIGCPSSGDLATAAHEALMGLHRGSDTDVDFAEPESMFEPGWYLRADNIWSKPNPMPESVTDRPTKAHEYVFLLSKQPRYFFDQEAVREPAEYGRRQWSGDVHAVVGMNGAKGSSTTSGSDPSAGRNVRSVWEIATQPYPDAHFATFPEALPERAIKAGCPEQVCVTCGEPRVRIIERDREYDHTTTAVTALAERNDLNGGADGHDIRHGVRVSTQTLGWTDCGHGNYRTGVVLDPFMGSGTTALVARRLGRRSIGVELNEAYAALCARRLQQLSLFAEEQTA